MNTKNLFFSLAFFVLIGSLFSYEEAKKEKEEMHEAVISRTSKGGYIAKGVTKDGHKMALIMSKANAELAIEKGLATIES